MNAADVSAELKQLGSPKKAANSAWFFKTGKGQYAEGDQFIGVTVPELRRVSKKYSLLNLTDVQKLLQSKIHEERLTALYILVNRFNRAKQSERDEIFALYCKNFRHINNWDLVDSSAPQIVGAWLEDKDKTVLVTWAQSSDLWTKRIAMLSTFHEISHQSMPDTALLVAEILLHDKHDLIQKAVGWMLREVGKRCSQEIEEEFLKKHYKVMPRTMLRYAIERFDEPLRKQYLLGKVS